MEQTLRDLFAYNAWANALVFDTCRGVDQASLDEPAPGTHGTILDTLKHFVLVEVLFLHWLRDEPLDLADSAEEFYAHDLTWFAERAAQAGQQYTALLAGASEAFSGEQRHVPWIGVTLTKRDGLLQALGHSAQHRAQVFSALGARGSEVPGLDYVIFVESRAADQPPVGEELSTQDTVTAPVSSVRRRRWPWGRK